MKKKSVKLIAWTRIKIIMWTNMNVTSSLEIFILSLKMSQLVLYGLMIGFDDRPEDRIKQSKRLAPLQNPRDPYQPFFRCLKTISNAVQSSFVTDYVIYHRLTECILLWRLKQFSSYKLSLGLENQIFIYSAFYFSSFRFLALAQAWRILEVP